MNRHFEVKIPTFKIILGEFIDSQNHCTLLMWLYFMYRMRLEHCKTQLFLTEWQKNLKILCRLMN